MLCQICPHNCRLDRNTKLGVCQAPASFKIAHAQLHLWEEPCISGQNSSGAIFFSHCNLKCVYCQNHEISQKGQGEIFTLPQLLKLCLKLKNQGAHNLNLVSPTCYTDLLLKILPEIKQQTNLPIIWNSNAYEKVEILQQLEGLVDVYLPDFKYANNDLALKYSQATNYFPVALAAIKEMVRQQPQIEIDEFGLIKKGVMIRHLVLPGQINDSQNILQAIKDNFKNKAWISLMAQYYPTYKASEYPELNAKLSPQEYRAIKDFYEQLNFSGGYFQELDSSSQAYTPIWDEQSLEI